MSGSSLDTIYVSTGKQIFNFTSDLLSKVTIVAGTFVDSWNGDGNALVTNLKNPRGLFVVERNGGELYFVEEENHIIRKLSFVTNNITTIAGNGTAGYSDGVATLSMLNYPHSVHVSNTTGEIYIADTFNCKLRRVFNGQMETIAGYNGCGFDVDGKRATETKLNYPQAIRVSNNEVYFADSANNRIRKITTDGSITTIAGNGMQHFDTEFFLYNPTSIEVSSDGNVYFLEKNNQKIRVIEQNYVHNFAGFSPNTERIQSLGQGFVYMAETQLLTACRGIAVDLEGNIYMSESYANRVLKLDISTKTLKIVVGADSGLAGFLSDIDGMAGTKTLLNFPQSLVMDSSYQSLYISDSNNHRVIRYNISSDTVYRVAGNGTAGYNGEGLAINCQLNNPNGLFYNNGILYISDTGNRRIRIVSNGIVSNIDYLFKAPTSIYVETIQSQTSIFVTDGNSVAIIIENIFQYLTTFPYKVTNMGRYKGMSFYTNSEDGYLTNAGNTQIGTVPGFDDNKLRYPTAFTVDQNGTLIICDSGNQLIRKYNDTTSKLSTIAGYGAVYREYNGEDPQFVDLSANLAMSGNNLILYSQSENLVLQYNLQSKGVKNLIGPCLGGYYNSEFDNRKTKLSGISGITKCRCIVRAFTDTITFDLFGSGSSVVNNRLTDIPRPKLIVPYKEGGYLFFSDNILIRLASNNTISKVAGGGTRSSDGSLATDFIISSAVSLSYDSLSDSIYYVDTVGIRKIDSNGIVTTVYIPQQAVSTLYVSNINGIVYFAENGRLKKLNKEGKVDIIMVFYSNPNSIVVSESTGEIFFANARTVYKISVNCPTGYFISNFENCLPICYGKNSSDACNGIERGQCVSPNQCNCTLNYSGNECSQLRISPESSKQQETQVVLIATLVPILSVFLLIVIIVILIIILIFYFRKKKKSNENLNLEMIESKNDITATDFPESEASIFFRPTMEFQSVSSSTNGTSSSSSSFDPLSRFKDMVKIGSGGFGSVFRAFDVKTNSFKALKAIKFQSYSELNQFMKEGLQLLNMAHPNIIKVNDMFVDKNELLVIEMEYYDKGDLTSLLKVQISETLLKSVLFQMLNALEYIHEEKKLIHRDVKESNIFIKELTQDYIQVVLADFGLARDNSLSANNSYCGTPMFLSPELGLGASYGFNTDVYSLGVTIYQLMTHDTTTAISHLHFSKDSSQVKQILTENMQKPNIYSTELIELVIEMVGKDSATRPQARQLLKYPYFK
ncbi:predicted protein [Naegleria gruberi]|uniref:Predicted protein n=1 Tax=Naegleria gruberi TaxID=5762 RepID=D2VUG2_NAEGR|nr:uncharacterized protein NAEGRDRAFT_72652 [Naegleria gruberi]EFC39508.1 predicted protein [Naegleria gruberi]|eukprot:XP_002672252.1 predicted protein [Naegleria gruberi strain NEG-M]